MAVYTCSKCSALVSLSVIPGGNPVANQDSGSWADSWRLCSECGIICSQCAPLPELNCPDCDKSLESPTEKTILAMMFPTKRIETERDLPLYVRNGKTKEERIQRLNSDRMKKEVLPSEYEAYLRIIESVDSAGDKAGGTND